MRVGSRYIGGEMSQTSNIETVAALGRALDKLVQKGHVFGRVIASFIVGHKGHVKVANRVGEL